MLTLRLRNRLAELARLQASLRSFAHQHAIAERELLGLELAFEELLSNVIEYAFEDEAEHWIEVRLAMDGPDLRVEIEDDGRPFDPLGAAEPDLEAPLEERPIGGLGLHLVRNLVDELAYRRDGAKNVTAFRKRGIGPSG